MNSDVVSAVETLREGGVLSPSQARLFGRVARGELVSVRQELRLLLYAAVLVTMSGVGLLVGQNLERIGPVAVAAALALAAASCLAWVARHAPPFSWTEAASTHLAFDYLLLLGVLLAAADLAYVEAQFTPLGPAWAWHLLIVAAFTGALAVRYDSRVVFSLSLTSFAAWRGVSVSLLETAFWSWSGAFDSLRANAVGCGVLFLLLGAALVRTGRKPHFEPVAVHLGWIAILGALVSGIGTPGAAGAAFGAALFLTGGGLAAFAFAGRRFPLFTMGVVGGYAGLSALVLRGVSGDVVGYFWFLVTSLGLLGGLLLAHRRMRVAE